METEAHGSYWSTSYLWMFPILYFFVSLVFDLLSVNFGHYKIDADLTHRCFVLSTLTIIS